MKKKLLAAILTVAAVCGSVAPVYAADSELVAGGVRGLGKVEKIYLDNTNLIYALGRENSNIGNIRETFFYNQMRVKQDIISSKISDFQIGERTFEIGGKNKGQQQITGAKEGYIVKDDIETGYGNIIPLWNFGMNY